MTLSPSVQQSILMYLVDPEFYPVALSELQNIYGDPNMIAQMTICPKAKVLASHFGVKFTRDNIRKTSHEYSKMSEMSDSFVAMGPISSVKRTLFDASSRSRDGWTVIN